MKKKIILTVLLLVLPFMITVVHADMGPKPSTEITFKGLGEGTYYVSIFGTEHRMGPNGPLISGITSGMTTGPYGDLEGFKKYYSDYPEEIIDQFVEYTNGKYCFWGNLNKVTTENNKITWSYYAPSDFIVVVITPQGKLIASEPVQRSVIAGYYKCTLEGDTLKMQSNYNWGKERLRLLARVAATIAIELVIALIFGYRDKASIATIVKTNIVTQLILNLGVSFMNILFGILGAYLIMILMEIIVFIIEGIHYSCKLPGKKGLAWLYALVANAASWYIGSQILVIMSAYV